MASSPPGNINIYDPIEVARANPYFKRNHMGQVTCTLCNLYCTEENNFLKHIAGKTHTLQLERRQHKELRHLREQEEERRNAEAQERARKEEALLALSTGQSLGGPSSSSTAAAAAAPGQNGAAATGASGAAAAAAAAAANARFGTPLYAFRTEHDPVAFRTKVWIEVMFTQAEEGTRPLHRWLSAREQHMEKPADDYFVYLLFACEGYATLSLKFPAQATRSIAGELMKEVDGTYAEAYLCSWDSLRKVYSMFFVLSR